MENNLLLAIFILLAATVALVPLAKAAGFGTVLGYLVAGVLIGPYGVGLITEPETIQHIAEFGVVMMLFLIGLELQPRELWRMRNKIAGLGLTQLIGTAVLVGGIAYLLGQPWQTAVVIGLALAMSSTAIALQTIESRSITHTDTGRGGIAVLLVQDVAVIPILAVIPLLAIGHIPSGAAAAEAHAPVQGADWWFAVRIVLAFAGTIFAGRYLVRPIMYFIAHSGVREAFVAFGLALVVGTALLMQWIGLSAALGAFLGGVLLADSEYRHELESTLEPFKGLLLGLFFISVGTSIAFSVLVAQPLTIIGLVLGLVLLKAAVLFVLASFFRMHLTDRILMAVLLSQSGEFAFVLLQFAESAGSLDAEMLELLTVTVALSMAVTPILLFAFDKLITPRLNADTPEPEPDMIDSSNKVIVLGYGRFGQIVTRLLKAQGFELTLIDDDPRQIELVKRFGVKVYYGDGTRLEILDAAGAGDAELIVLSLPDGHKIVQTAQLIRRHFPHVKIAARALDRPHAHELMDAGVDALERETFRGALALGAKSLELLGYSTHRATRLANAFEKYDNAILIESRDLRGDDDAYFGYMRQSIDMLDRVMQADAEEHGDSEPEKSSADIDKKGKKESD